MKTKIFTYLFFAAALFVSKNTMAQCMGGSVSAMNGDTILYTCANDGVADIINFTHVTTSMSNYAYVITDDQNVVLGLPPANMADVSGAGIGTCRVWGVSYTGTINMMAGDTVGVTAYSTGGCFDWSTNFLEVRRDVPLGGTVSAMNGDTVVYTCANDSMADIINFTHVTGSVSTYAYVITDDQNNVLGLPPGNMADVSGAGVGTCRVWGVSYTGNVTLTAGMVVGTDAFSDECFDWSTNFLEVRRDVPAGGTVSDAAGNTTDTIIAGDGIADVINFAHVTGSTSRYAYVITDDNDEVVGLPGNMADLEGAGIGVCRVWGVSYTGTRTIAVGDTVGIHAFSDECFDWSTNFLEVTRNGATGIEDLISEKNAIGIYPNPVSQQFNIVTENFSSEHTLIILDVTGKIVLEQLIRDNNRAIDVNQLETGVYFVKINGGEINSATRIIKY